MSFPCVAYTVKTDIADAYCIIPIHPSEYPKLGMTFQGKFYYDKNLPQRRGSSCRMIETLSTAIMHFCAPCVKMTHMRMTQSFWDLN